MRDRNPPYSPQPTLVGRLLDPDSRDAAIVGLMRRPAAAARLRGLVVLAAHGGAGATTVTTFLDPGQSGWAIEAPPGRGSFPSGRRVVLVSRSTAYGLAATARTVASWSPQHMWPWLVLVADAPVTPPLPVLYRVAALRDQLAGVTSLPYLHRMRACDSPTEAMALPAVARAAAALRNDLVGQAWVERQ